MVKSTFPHTVGLVFFPSRFLEKLSHHIEWMDTLVGYIDLLEASSWTEVNIIRSVFTYCHQVVLILLISHHVLLWGRDLKWPTIEHFERTQFESASGSYPDL